MTNAVLYQDMSKVSKRLLERKLRFTGHYQELKINQSAIYCSGTTQTYPGVGAVKERELDLITLRDYYQSVQV